MPAWPRARAHSCDVIAQDGRQTLQGATAPLLGRLVAQPLQYAVAFPTPPQAANLVLIPSFFCITFAQDTRQTLQAATASLLGRLAAQPLHGPRVMLLLNKLLPPGLAAAIRDGPG